MGEITDDDRRRHLRLVPRTVLQSGQRLRGEINAWLDTLARIAGFGILAEEAIWHEFSRGLPIEIGFGLLASARIARAFAPQPPALDNTYSSGGD